MQAIKHFSMGTAEEALQAKNSTSHTKEAIKTEVSKMVKLTSDSRSAKTVIVLLSDHDQ